MIDQDGRSLRRKSCSVRARLRARPAGLVPGRLARLGQRHRAAQLRNDQGGRKDLRHNEQAAGPKVDRRDFAFKRDDRIGAARLDSERETADRLARAGISTAAAN